MMYASYVTFRSHHGHIDIHGFYHIHGWDDPDSNAIGVTGGFNFLTLFENKMISFYTGRTTARNLTVVAAGGIYVSQDIMTYGGDLWLNWTTNDLVISSGKLKLMDKF